MKTTKFEILRKMGVVLLVGILACLVITVCNTTKSFADEPSRYENEMLGDDESGVAKIDERYNKDLDNLVTDQKWKEEQELKNTKPHIYQTKQGEFHEVLGFKYNMRGYFGYGQYGHLKHYTVRTADVQFFYNTETHKLLVLALRWDGDKLDTKYETHNYHTSDNCLSQTDYDTNFGKINIGDACTDIFLDNRLTKIQEFSFEHFYALNRICFSEVDTAHHFVSLNTRNHNKLEEFASKSFYECKQGLKIVLNESDIDDNGGDAYHGYDIRWEYVGVYNLSGHCNDTNRWALKDTLVQAIEPDGTIIGTALTDSNGQYELRICKNTNIKLKFTNGKYGSYTTEEFCMNDNRGYDHVFMLDKYKLYGVCEHEIGPIYGKTTSERIHDCKVEVIDDNGNVLQSTEVNQYGEYELVIKANTNFKVRITSAQYGVVESGHITMTNNYEYNAYYK